MRQQITFSGFVFTAVLVLVGIAAFVSANNLMFLLFAALLATFLISGLVNRLGLAGLELNLVVPEHIAAGRYVTGRLRIRNTKLFVPSFSLHLSGSPQTGLTSELYIPVIPAAARLDEPVELIFAKRGIYKENTFSFTSRFPFGFTQRRAQVRLDHEVIVYPSIDPLAGFAEFALDIAGEIESRQRGRGNDFYRIRPYEASESARHVDWRATAHTGKVQVREFARDQDDSATIFLDLDVDDADADWFEVAVHCCAYLLWRLTEKGTPVRLLTQRFDMRVPEGGTIYGILRYLALVAPLPGTRAAIPHDRNYQIAVSARPEKLAETGWSYNRIISIDDLQPARAERSAGAAARPGSDLHHRT